VGDGNHTDRGLIPEVGGVELGDGDVEGGAQLVFEAADNLALVLERLRVLDAEFEGEGADDAVVSGQLSVVSSLMLGNGSKAIGNLCQSNYHHCRTCWGTTMPTRNINLTAELDRYIDTKVKSGRYENASEVVRAGLRTLEREEQEYEIKLAALRAAIDEGDASGVALGDVFKRVRKKLKLPVAR